MERFTYREVELICGKGWRPKFGFKHVFPLKSVFASESDLVELVAPYFCSTWQLLRWDWELVVNTWAWLQCCIAAKLSPDYLHCVVDVISKVWRGILSSSAVLKISKYQNSSSKIQTIFTSSAFQPFSICEMDKCHVDVSRLPGRRALKMKMLLHALCITFLSKKK